MNAWIIVIVLQVNTVKVIVALILIVDIVKKLLNMFVLNKNVVKMKIVNLLKFVLQISVKNFIVNMENMFKVTLVKSMNAWLIMIVTIGKNVKIINATKLNVVQIK